MNKKKKIIVVSTIVLLVMMTLSGCVAPGAKFDTVKIVATVARNGGDFELTPSGGSGYDMRVTIGTLSIEALGFDLDQQAIVDTYKIEQNNYKLMTKNQYGGGILGTLKAWWYRTTSPGALRMNTVTDLAWASGAGDYSIDLPLLRELDVTDYLGNFKQVFSANSSNAISIPEYGLGIYSVKIPRSYFPNNNPTVGYVTNNLNNPKGTGVRVTPEGKNTGFVMWDGSDYNIIVLTNQPAFARNRLDTIYVSVTLIKPNIQQGFTSLVYKTKDYLDVYATGMEQGLRTSTANLRNNIDDALDSAVSSAFSKIPGGGIVKGMSDVGSLFNPLPALTQADKSNMEWTINTIYNRQDIYKTAYRQLYRDMQNIHVRLPWSITTYTINLNDGLSKKEIECMIFAYTNTGAWGSKVDAYQKFYLVVDAFNNDIEIYKQANNLESFYKTAIQGDTVSFSGNVFSVQLSEDDTFLSIIDAGTGILAKDLFDIKWTQSLTSLGLDDLDDFRNDIIEKTVAEVYALMPNYISSGMQGVVDKVDAMNVEIAKLKVEIADLNNYIKRMIPTKPAVEIFAYQVPPPLYTKAEGKKGEFTQFSPTSIFSAGCSVSVGGTDNWELSSGYPRAVIVTESRGVHYIELSLDTTTDSYILRQDMIGTENLSVGDTVRTYFEAQVENKSDANDTKIKRTNTYYTRIEKCWLTEALDRLGLLIDNAGSKIEEIKDATNWLSFPQNPFNSGNDSALDSFYAIITVKNQKGEELYINSPRKDFKMKQNDSYTLVWEVRIFEDESYDIHIVVGNSSVSELVSYSTTVNEAQKSVWKPSTWFAKDE